MADRKLPSPETLRKLLRYEPETGALYWRERDEFDIPNPNVRKRWNTKNAGRRAFTAQMKSGYFQGRVNGTPVLAHRVIWAIHHNEWPSLHVDHINGLPWDNRIVNLRAVSAAENLKNAWLSRVNTSGRVGVYRHRSNRWKASIRVDGKDVHLGCFTEFEKAVAARKEAEKRYGFTPRHGQKRPDDLSEYEAQAAEIMERTYGKATHNRTV